MSINFKVNLLFVGFALVGITLAGRLFYWQIINSDRLKVTAEGQRWSFFEIPAQRGEIKASDGSSLANSKEAYLLYASLPQVDKAPAEIAAKILPFLENTDEEGLKTQLNRKNVLWVPLKHKVSRQAKEGIENLNLKGLGFEKEETRNYPEGSMSAHLLGFVGVDANGQDKGYFGLEGYYDLELKGKPGAKKWEKDASGKPILLGENMTEEGKNGRTLVTTIDRTVQYLIEIKLKEGIEKYGAKSGTIIVMEPGTGAILGMASQPSYDPSTYYLFEKTLYRNPAVSLAYEPGSTFKVVVMAAALNEKAVDEETVCDKCSGPRTIGEYTIKTSTEKYYPNSNLTDIIKHSDNVGMVFVSEKLGLEKTLEYLKRFGFGQKTGIDLEDEDSPALRADKNWRTIDLATVAFGQGIAVTPLQMVRAVGSIANKGKLVEPFIVKKVIDGQKVSEITPPKSKQIISPATASQVTKMMVEAVEAGEAKLAKLKGFEIAGKTGTAQIPLEGHYDKEKTVASFVGFAPAQNPRFVMLVTLREPSASIWGSSTAAPLWLEISKELFTYFGVLPGV